MLYRPANPISAALYGGVLAALIAYLACLAGLGLGVANVTAPGAPRASAEVALSRAGLNLYAIQHTALTGSGTITSDFAETQKVSTRITLPLTIWGAIPAVALMIGGYWAGVRRRGAGIMSIVLTAVFAGVFYAIILSACSFVFRMPLDPSAMPSIGGTDFNPPPIRLRPDLVSAMLSTCLFGIVFAYLGGMIASQGERGRMSPNRWWACGKAITLTAIVVQLLVVLGLGVWLIASPPEDMSEPSTRWQVFGMSPTAAGAVYSLIHGATLVGAVESPIQSDEDALGGRANVYTGLNTAVDREGSKPLDLVYTYIAAAIGVLAALFAGSLAVKWGSRDGSVQTALRIAVILAALVWALTYLCSFGWSSREGGAAFTLSIGFVLGAPFFAAVGVAFLASLLGAFFASAWYSGRRGFPVDL